MHHFWVFVVAAHATLGSSMISLYNLMIGNSKGGDVTPEGSTLGPLFVIVFTLLTTLLLLNMFVAVLVHAFSKMEPSPSVGTVFNRHLHHPRVKKRLARVYDVAMRASCGLLRSSVPDATEDIVQDMREHATSRRQAELGADAREGALDEGGTLGVHSALHLDAGALKRIEGKLAHDMDLNLQCLLQLSKEVRSLSHRIKHLTETAAEPAVFS